MATRLRITVSLFLVLTLALLCPQIAPGSRAYGDAYGSTTVVSTSGARVPINLYTTAGDLCGQFNESHFVTTDGSHVYCANAAAKFQAGTFTSHDPLEFMNQKALTECALAQYYIAEVDDVIPVAYRYAVTQCWIWSFLNSNGCAPTEMHDITGYVIDGYDATASWNAFLAWLGEHEDEYVGHGIYWVNGSHQPVCQFWTAPATGGIDLTKVSGNPSVTDGNGCYDLAGATYEVRNSAGDVVATMTTDRNGQAHISGLPVGSYTLKETSSARGYAINVQAIDVTVVAGQNSAARTFDYPQSCPVDLLLKKVDAEGGTEASQGSASLEGAEFTVRYYATTTGYDPAKPDRTWVVRTDAEGHATLDDAHWVSGDTRFWAFGSKAVIPVGAVTIQETKAPTGYRLNSTVYERVITPNDDGAEAITVYDVPTVPEDVERGGIMVTKIDHVLKEGVAQGDATLAGAKIAITNASDGPVLFDGAQVAPGEVVTVVETDEQGAARADGLPFGTYTLNEVEAPTGYDINTDWSPTVTISSDGVVQQAEPLEDAVVRGGVRIAKLDDETGLAQPLGKATLAGATFQIVNASAHDVEVDGSIYAPGTTVATITTDESGVAESGENLPFGTYRIVEIQAPEGYNLPADVEAAQTTFRITEAGVVDLTQPGSAATDQVIRGDYHFNKHAQTTMAPLAHVPFAITSATTGESHIAVTDANGYLSTSAGKNAHSTRTNANDAVLLDDGTVDEAAIDETAGIWFSGSTGLATAPDDALGALPYDTYEVRELPCSANAGLNLAEWTIVVSSDGYDIDGGTFVDTPAPSIATTLTGDGTSHLAAADQVVELTDTVSYGGLEPGQAYTLSGELHLVADDGTDAGIVATAQHDFTPTGESGTETVTFAFDASELAGRTVVAFERLTQDGQTVVEHADLSDAGQTVHFPTIGTTLSGMEGEKTLYAEDVLKLKDTVSYENLVPGKAYTVSGTLHVRDAEGHDAGALTDEEGRPVTATREFVAEGPSGQVEVVFCFPGTIAAGKQVVAFETLGDERTTWAVHANIDDEAQTVEVPEIHTRLEASDGTKTVPVGKDVVLTDSVAYTHLTSHVTYLIEGSIHRCAPDGTDAGVVATGSVTFTPEASSGSIDVSFTLDTTSYQGETLVAFESLHEVAADGETASDGGRAAVTDGSTTDAAAADGSPGRMLASHRDIMSADQSVQVADIETTAHDAATGNHTARAQQQATIVDAVAYHHLTPGKTYTVTGTLHLRADDGSDAGALLDSEGNAASTSTTFTPTTADGSVDVTFTLDASMLAGSTVVAFEELTDDGTSVAAHADITDDGQSVTFVSIGTSAVSADTGNTTMALGDQATLVDTVAYSGLIPGEDYEVVGTLVNRETDEPIVDSADRPVTASTTFTPDAATGSIDVTFLLDTSALAGTDIVVFETVIQAEDGATVAEHADLNDRGQTVTVADIGTTAVNGKDNTHLVQPDNPATIVDTVRYRGLVPGQTYTVKGTLMDADTGSTLIIGNVPVEAQTDFVAEDTEGSVEVTFTFDASAVNASTLVAFEELWQDEVLIARHADLDDAEQTVSIADRSDVPPGDVFAKAGSVFLKYWWLFTALAAAAVGGIVLGLRQRRVHRDIEQDFRQRLSR